MLRYSIHTKNIRKLVVLGLIAAGGVALTAIVISPQDQAPSSSEVPAILILYEGSYHRGRLEGYQWSGGVYPASNEYPNYDYPTINVTSGSTIEFMIENDTSPTYYLVSATDTLMHPPLGYEDEAIVINDVRLNGSRMTIDFGKSNYFVVVSAQWISFDGYVKHEDTVTYGFMIRIK